MEIMYDEENYDKYAPIDDETWYYVVRRNTNERLLNKSNDVNVCKGYHLKELLAKLNQYGFRWEAMTISEYNRKFGNVR